MPKRRASTQHMPGLDAEGAPWLSGVRTRRLCELLAVGDERAVKAERVQETAHANTLVVFSFIFLSCKLCDTFLKIKTLF